MMYARMQPMGKRLADISVPKSRLLALDGIRGFAALSVVISHIGFNTRAVIDSPIVLYVFRIFSAGPTAVQLFFVLSGFLMAYLYPTVADPFKFWQKRYLRIMPVFAVVVVGLWLSKVYLFSASPWVGLGVLLATAVTAHLIWLLVARLQKKWPNIGHILFLAYCIFKLSWLGISLLTALGPGAQLLATLDVYEKNAFHMLSNLSMTMYWQNDLVVLEGVFWSLVPEVMFYLMYPVVVVPVLTVGRSLKYKWNFVFVASILLLLFQLDTASRGVFSIDGIFISRASGFVMGIVLGSLYRTKNHVWQKAASLLAKPYLGIPLLLLFAVTMALEWPDRYHQIRHFVMFHYFGLSVLFSLVIAAALVQGSLIQRIFEKKLFVFMGMISYSLYLTHSFVMEKMDASSMVSGLQSQLSSPAFAVARSLVLLASSVIIATLLYYLVEALYFRKWPTTTVSSSIHAFFSTLCSKLGTKQFLYGGAAFISLTMLLFSAGDSVPSLLLSTHSLTKNTPLSIIQVTGSKPQKFTFVAEHPQLSAIQLAMDYAQDPNVPRDESVGPVELHFTLTDDASNEIVHSIRHPQELAGEPLFPFGFPTQAESKEKTYSVELRLEKVGETDEVILYPQTGLIAQYTTDQEPISARKIGGLAANRVLFGLRQWPTITGIALVGFAVLRLGSKSKSKNHADTIIASKQ